MNGLFLSGDRSGGFHARATRECRQPQPRTRRLRGSEPAPRPDIESVFTSAQTRSCTTVIFWRRWISSLARGHFDHLAGSAGGDSAETTLGGTTSTRRFRGRSLQGLPDDSFRPNEFAIDEGFVVRYKDRPRNRLYTIESSESGSAISHRVCASP